MESQERIVKASQLAEALWQATRTAQQSAEWHEQQWENLRQLGALLGVTIARGEQQQDAPEEIEQDPEPDPKPETQGDDKPE